jgi:hypothetical protein
MAWASAESDAEHALSAYLEASINERHEEAYEYLSDEDRATMTLEEYNREKRDNIIITCDEFTSRTSFKLKGVEVEKDRAHAEVEITEPDIRVILSDVLGAFIASLLDEDEDLKQMEKDLEDKYSEGNIPMKTRTEYYNLVKERGVWKIDL